MGGAFGVAQRDETTNLEVPFMPFPSLAVPIAIAALAPVAAAVSIDPARVPARGAQQATLSLERAGMVHVEAHVERGGTGHGVACTLVDHLRGPFATSGAAGAEDCATDLLLDPGTYRVRLAPP